jgi:hypothetical protein
MTTKLWTKQLCYISKEGEILINGTTGIMRRHFVHRKCKAPIIIEKIIDKDRLRCSKCGQIIPPKSIVYMSNITGNFLRDNDITIGEALLDNLDNKILLVDMEYIRRYDKKSVDDDVIGPINRKHGYNQL